MNKKRLLKLADMLDENASNKRGMKFDLGTVGRADVEDYYMIPDGYKPSLDCGTVGCAMGLAAISGKFKRAGLGHQVFEGSIWCTIDGFTTEYDDAAKEIFDISDEQAHLLFSPHTYNPRMRRGARAERFVARRIRRMVEGKPIKEWWS